MSNVKPPLGGKMGIYAQQLLTVVKYMREGSKGPFINDVIISSGYSRFSLQTTHVLRVYDGHSMHGWSEEIPAENEDVIYEQPLSDTRMLQAIDNSFSFCDFPNHYLSLTSRELWKLLPSG